MTKSLILVVVTFMLSVGPAFGQQCVPTPSPVLSSSLTDIPPTNHYVTTYDGRLVPARANLNLAYVQMTPNEYRVWFGPDADPGASKIFYNRRYRADEASPWYWEFNVSPAVLTAFNPQTSVGAVDVFYWPGAFRNAQNGQYYNYLMYLNDQPGPCGGIVAGFLYASFSNNGTCWTTPQRATYIGAPSFPCDPRGPGIPVEQVGAIMETNGFKIYFVGIEGNIQELIPRSKMSQTQTYLGYATFINDPTAISIWDEGGDHGQVSNLGMLNPAIPGYPADDRYTPYHYFINLGLAYDDGTGYIYLGRAYPYPFDRGPASPSEVPQQFVTPCGGQETTCNASPATLPNRVQVYKMYIGFYLSSIKNIKTGTWTLVGDWGYSAGYWKWTLPSDSTCPAFGTPLVSGQTATARDHGSVSFLKTPTGRTQIIGNDISVFSGDTFKFYRSTQSSCLVTGFEGMNLLTFPR